MRGAAGTVVQKGGAPPHPAPGVTWPGAGPGRRRAEACAWLRPSLGRSATAPCGGFQDAASPRRASWGPGAERRPLGSCPGHGDGGARSSRPGAFTKSSQGGSDGQGQGTENLLGPEGPTPGRGSRRGIEGPGWAETGGHGACDSGNEFALQSEGRPGSWRETR